MFFRTQILNARLLQDEKEYLFSMISTVHEDKDEALNEGLYIYIYKRG